MPVGAIGVWLGVVFGVVGVVAGVVVGTGPGVEDTREAVDEVLVGVCLCGSCGDLMKKSHAGRHRTCTSSPLGIPNETL